MATIFDVAALEAQGTDEAKDVGVLSITSTPNQQSTVSGIDTVSLAVWAWWRPSDHSTFIEELTETQVKAKLRMQSNFSPRSLITL